VKIPSDFKLAGHIDKENTQSQEKRGRFNREPLLQGPPELEEA
jgi:hypothetical protein